MGKDVIILGFILGLAAHKCLGTNPVREGGISVQFKNNGEDGENVLAFGVEIPVLFFL